jgi:hypothetical protein
MRVGWDARILVNGERRGMGTYAFHVLRALRECRPDVELTLFHDQGGRDVPVDGIDAREIGPKRGYRWQLWERVGLPFHAYTRGCDLVHSPANTTPPRCPVPRVVTLHDALPFHDWNESAVRLPYFRDTQRRAIKRADAIITDSQYSKSDICDTLKIEPSRVTVIPLASSPDLRRPPSDEVAAELARLQLTSPFIVALGATGVGPQLEPMLLKEMEALAIAPSRVRCLGFVDQQQLAVLYTACDAFWFLSLYEGFGLPILDALRCGAVVVCSTRTSCPEVAGDAAMMVDPEDVDGVAAATLAALAMDGPTRARWRARGEAHAATFTWQRTAAMTAQVYNTIAGNA